MRAANTIEDAGASAFASALKGNSRLTSLRLARACAAHGAGHVMHGCCPVTRAAHVAAVPRRAGHVMHGHVPSCAGNRIRDDGAAALAGAVARNSTLTGLDLSREWMWSRDCHVTVVHCSYLPVWPRVSHVRSRDSHVMCADNEVDDAGATELSVALARNRALTSIDLMGESGLTITHPASAAACACQLF